MEELNIEEDELITRRDLENFKTDLLRVLEDLLAKQHTGGLQKSWLKSAEVCKTLGISQGKLQAMRNNRKITYTQIGGNMYYYVKDIYDMFEANKVIAINGEK